MTYQGQNDSFQTKDSLQVGNQSYTIYNLETFQEQYPEVKKLPFSLKVLLENLLRYEDNSTVKKDDILALVDWAKNKTSHHEIAYRPTRVLMQDFTGVPAVVDLAAMRDAMSNLNGDTQKINPLSPVDLVIDHSVMVDAFANPNAFKINVDKEYERNLERYKFLRWGQSAFNNFRVVPPGTGICHQVNLENLAKTIWSSEANGEKIAYPDSVVGTDSHTTMINGLAVLGWGVGGIEAEAVMLGQPISMLIPEVIGFKLSGKLKEGTTATDLVLTVTQMLREKGVVGKFVEFFGDGLDSLSLADRATISNMAPEYGATCGFFPIDQETLNYLEFSGRDDENIALVEAYAKKQGFWRESGAEDPIYTDALELDLFSVEPSLAGPKRPQDRVKLSNVRDSYLASKEDADNKKQIAVEGFDFDLTDGDVVISAITSCTNTSNPSVMIGAGLVAKKALEKGLKVKPWVKTSLAPGSQVVTDYLEKAGLQDSLNELGYNLVGYGCTTCIGNSGPLPEHIEKAIQDGNINVSSVLSGNRNFEGRVHPLTKANYLASPPLVVAYALAGTVDIDLANDPLGQNDQGEDVFLKDIWPTNQEVQDVVQHSLTPEMFRDRYANVFEGEDEWKNIQVGGGQTYSWDDQSTYVKNPPFFEGMSINTDSISDIKDAGLLALLGDSVTTDHISPAGAIKKDSPAGTYLTDNGVSVLEFNSYGSRRGNHEVMMRGTFANIRIRNEMVPGVEGGYTIHYPTGEQMSIYDAAMRYQEEGKPLVVVAGKEYGTGSSRDWAAKGTKLLGVKAVIAESFERIHRSNLIGMGVLPLKFINGENRKNLNIQPDDNFSILGLEEGLTPEKKLDLIIQHANGETTQAKVQVCILTENELNYYLNGGILSYVLRNMIGETVAA